MNLNRGIRANTSEVRNFGKEKIIIASTDGRSTSRLSRLRTLDAETFAKLESLLRIAGSIRSVVTSRFFFGISLARGGVLGPLQIACLAALQRKRTFRAITEFSVRSPRECLPRSRLLAHYNS